MTVEQLAELIKNAGLAGALSAVVLGGIRKWYVWGWLYRDCQKERDEWKSIALRGLGVAEKAIDSR